jgi:glycolate oxidase iron-sulfur subunit
MSNADQQKPSSFDAHHPPAPELISTCVHCGFCLSTCPTYVLWGNEMDSPRGRIYLMKMASEGATQMTPQFVHHMDTCLGCVACMPACPSGVDYGKLIEATRAQVERNFSGSPFRGPRSWFEKLHRRLIFATFPQPERLRMLRWPLAAYQRSGLQWLVRRSGALKLVPKGLRAMETLLPRLAPVETVQEVTPALGQRRLRAGLLLGCVQREFLSPVNAATVRVLAAAGCEVVAPPSQSCCGALLVHAGEEASALDYARKTIDAFEHANVEVLITNAAGCGSNVKDYGHLLRDDPQYAERARKFSAKCKDVTEVLADLKPFAALRELPLRVAFHDSCHLQHAQGVRSQPRALLAQIPGVQLVEIPEGPICCGSAGIYNLVQPDAAAALGERKARLIADLKPDIVATGNPGCLLQLQSSLAQLGRPIPVVHTIQVLDAEMHGTPLRENGKRATPSPAELRASTRLEAK